MKKKLVIALLATALATSSLAGCGKKETANVPAEDTEVVAEVNTETEVEEIVVAETETEEFELLSKTEAENTEKTDEKTADTKETTSTGNKGTASNSGSTSTEKSTDKSADKSTSNTSSSTGNTSSGSTSTSTNTSGNTSTNSGTTSNTTTNNGNGSTATETAPSTQPETPVTETPAETPVETPTPEPELPSFPYELNVVYENGDGTGCIYIYDSIEDNNDGLMHGMTSMEYMVYEGEQEKKIEAVGGVASDSERLGHYKEGYIKKLNYRPKSS